MNVAAIGTNSMLNQIIFNIALVTFIEFSALCLIGVLIIKKYNV